MHDPLSPMAEYFQQLSSVYKQMRDWAATQWSCPIMLPTLGNLILLIGLFFYVSWSHFFVEIKLRFHFVRLRVFLVVVFLRSFLANQNKRKSLPVLSIQYPVRTGIPKPLINLNRSTYTYSTFCPNLFKFTVVVSGKH